MSGFLSPRNMGRGPRIGGRRIFVYGTLRRGERNHALLGSARFLSHAKTAPGFDLVDLGDFPALVAEGRGSVVGELYLVDAATLSALDRLEEHPNFFRRAGIPLAAGGRAEAYLLDRVKAQGRRVIASGDWTRRRQSGST